MYARLGEISRKRREREAEDAEEFGYELDESQYKDDLYYEELDIKTFNPLMQSYITTGLGSWKCRSITGVDYLTVPGLRVVVKHPIFSIFMNGCILLAGLMVGLASYEDLTAKYPLLIGKVEMFILVVFVMEFLMKVAMDPLRPWNFFVGSERRWNWFDFIIIVVCQQFELPTQTKLPLLCTAGDDFPF